MVDGFPEEMRVDDDADDDQQASPAQDGEMEEVAVEEEQAPEPAEVPVPNVPSFEVKIREQTQDTSSPVEEEVSGEKECSEKPEGSYEEFLVYNTPKINMDISL
eukprot:s194_g23.t1